MQIGPSALHHKTRAVHGPGWHAQVAYTLLLHGYVLSHRHQAENAYLVLEDFFGLDGFFF